MTNTPISLSPRCPIRTTLELVGGKWKLLILYQLMDRPLRPSALRKQIPDISEKMLIQELKNLTDSGLVLRKNYGEVPPKVSYQITEKGRNALPLIEAMRRFAEQYTEG
ncbi:MAG: winged helix-turn-helix transcriptional regulator [Bernardetiaceae bacterium]